MTRAERKLVSVILKCTDSYKTPLKLDVSSSPARVVNTVSNKSCDVPSFISEEDAVKAIGNLIKKGYLRKTTNINFEHLFLATYELKYRRAFWWDSVAKQFVAGFICGVPSGIVITVLGGLLLSYFRSKLGI